MTRGKYLWSIRVPLLLVALGMLCGISRGAAEKAYNGKWWLSIGADEQYGFLNGYADCYAFDYHGPTNYGVDAASPKQVTKFYRANVTELGLDVSEVLPRLRPPAGWTRPPDGQVHGGPHDGNDGQAWGVLGDDGELGYVEGYLWCWKNCLHSKGATFSKSPKEYVALINKWYGINPKTGINADRESAKIADVLYKFRDRKQSPQGSKR